jgi:general stress protein 26
MRRDPSVSTTGKESAMADEARIEEKFWKALRSDATVMLGLSGIDGGSSQPMAAQLDGESGPIWFFTARNTAFARSMGERHRAALHFASKGHDLFASLGGQLVVDHDRATIDRLWNRSVAAWYEDGQDDVSLLLIRFDPEDGQIWLNENSLWAGIKLLLGRDPKQEYADQVADLHLRPA